MTKEEAIEIATEYLKSRGRHLEYERALWIEEDILRMASSHLTDEERNEIIKVRPWFRLESHWVIHFDNNWPGVPDTTMVCVYQDRFATVFPGM